MSGLLLQNNFSITRTHAALIDLGGVVGMIGGLAAESLIYPGSSGGNLGQEHLANFALGGLGAGLLAAGILTRNLDDPSLPVAPAIGQAMAGDGRPTTPVGVTGRW